jgi:hypothetical protein
MPVDRGSKDGWSQFRLAYWVGLLLFSVYLLSFSGRFHVMDELAVFTVGHNLARHGSSDINQLIWTNHWTPHPPGVWGIDGNLYTKKPPGISLLIMPLVWLGHLLGLNAVHMGLLSGALIASATGALLLRWLLDLGFNRTTAVVTGLGYGLCTIAWIYARMLWALPVVGLGLTTAVWCIWRAELQEDGQGRRWLLIAGAIASLTLLFRYESLLFVGIMAFYLLLVSLRSPSPSHNTLSVQRWSGLVLFLMPLLPVGASLLLYNWVRFGSFSDTGYTAEILFTPSWFSLYGLTFSPGQGIFVYSPFLLLLFLGIPTIWRRLGHYGILVLSLPVLGWLFYSTWFSWGGIWNWGPRFMLTTLPLLMLPVAGAIDRYGGQTWFWLVTGVLAILSVLFNGMGMIVDFNEYFSRVPSNQAFILDWSYFPPLGNWRLFLEGLPVDLAWVKYDATGVVIQMERLLPPILMLITAVIGLAFALRSSQVRTGAITVFITAIVAISLLMFQFKAEDAGTDHSGAAENDDQKLLQMLAAEAASGDLFLISAPPYADFQELSTLLMAYAPIAMPTYLWVESGERAIWPQEREFVARSVAARSERIWHLERWQGPLASLSLTTQWLEAETFLISRRQALGSGSLSLFVRQDQTWATIPQNVHFEHGFSLQGFTLPQRELTVGELLPVRLHWQTEAVTTAQQAIVAFLHLLPSDNATHPLVQSDRLLMDPAFPERSLLRFDQQNQQGHSLPLPKDLSPGNYVLVAGLYEWKSSQRLSRIDGSGDDFIYLTTLSIVPAR